VTAGILPAVKGGIFATRTGRGQRCPERILHRLAAIHARSRRAGSPARRQPGMADATSVRHRVSCACRKLRRDPRSDGSSVEMRLMPIPVATLGERECLQLIVRSTRETVRWFEKRRIIVEC